MRLNRFFTERKHIAVGASVKLQDSDTSHVKKVLRLSSGDEIILFNGEREYLAVLTLVTKEFVTAEVKKILRSTSDELGISITLFQGLLKGGMFDLVVEKSVELGITQIIPVECEYSQMKLDVAEHKQDRWNKISLSAAKQSERLTIPEVSSPIRLSDIDENVIKQFDQVYFFTLEKGKIVTEQLPLKIEGKRIAYIVGPEGGFSPGEHEYLIKELDLIPYTLGGTVLRAETASIVAGGILRFLSSRD
jgi:16S rRNA (uracil1498-N3)-methyltransferase